MVVKKAKSLKSFDKLNLSEPTRKFLKWYLEEEEGPRNVHSIEGIIFDARCAFAQGDLDVYPSCRAGAQNGRYYREIFEALDAAGYIRHDIDEKSFVLYRFYRILFYNSQLKGEFPASVETFMYSSKKGQTDYKPETFNENYESFRKPAEKEYYNVRQALAKVLGGTGIEYRKILSLYGLKDCEPKTVAQVAKEFSTTSDSIIKTDTRALRAFKGERDLFPILTPF